MKYHTNEGKTYCVVGTAEGTVTSASGVVIASFSANEQSYFTAPAGGFVTISDDTAIVTPVFKLAPSALVGESGGGASGGENTVTYTFAEDGTYGIEGDFSGLTDGESMFYDNEDITFWSVDLPNLTNGIGMFQYCTNLRSFEGDLSALTDGIAMFYGCTNLTEWNTPLPKLEIGGGPLTGMFQECTNLRSFEGDLSAMTNGNSMFSGCTSLRSFEGDLSALTNGNEMFQECTNLTSFRGDLSALTNGNFMFADDHTNSSKLDLASVQHIAATINDLTDKTSDGTEGWGEIYIGVRMPLLGGEIDFEIAFEAIRAKGWTVHDISN